MSTIIITTVADCISSERVSSFNQTCGCLYQSLGVYPTVLLIGLEERATEIAKELLASEILFIETSLDVSEPQQVAQIVVAFLKEEPYSLVTFVGSDFYQEVAAWCGSLSGLRTVQECVGIRSQEGRFSVETLVYGSHLVANGVVAAPLFVTMSQVVGEAEVVLEQLCRKVVLDCPVQVKQWQIIERVQKKPEVNLASRPCVIVAGRGVTKKTLVILQELAQLLGAELAGTRAVTDLGWLGKDCLVGASGQVLSAKVCLVFGASGLPAFTYGIERCERVIAVNSDPEALIFSVADEGIIGDCQVIATKMLDFMKEGVINESTNSEA